ncbi:putative leucyl-tRNA synthetase [Candidatus Zinderia insecticola CARI]|uniref:Leucine--tRNA ligase n=1 Tax=Zinderia insecticola (strain CARI) TaxID=871271 RepID=E0TIY2_ZINIC|nr:putative leucyl-tRNA synthetase [Candidatus Zinderia insecticola CARI]
MINIYNHKIIELKIQKKKLKFKKKKNRNKKKYYTCSMIPYPSGKLHIGHLRNYIINDILFRYYNMKKYNTLMFMSWDSFGLPAENAAINYNITPYKWIKKNIKYMKKQILNFDLSINWKKEFSTCKKEYYKWNQWLFLLMFKKKLIYIKKKYVNWDPKDNTVLANEQIINGRGWRSNIKVKKKKIRMYYINILKYANELLFYLKKYLLKWPNKIKIMQKNWIGKNIVYNIIFNIHKKNNYKNIFNIKIKNIYLINFINFFLINKNNYIYKNIYKNKIKKYFNRNIFFNKIYLKNPLFNNKIEILYILNKYNKKNKNLFYINKNKKFIKKNYLLFKNNIIKDKLYFYSKYNNLKKIFLKNIIFYNLKKKKLCNLKTKFKLHNWGISRQRYWGTPIPLLNCYKCKNIFYKKKILILPKNLIPNGYINPLKNNKKFLKTKCFKCKNFIKKETDTMDTFVDSSWYFIKYIFISNNFFLFNKYFMPINKYIGGIEHSILHLLYSRFFTKVIRDLKLININEPFLNLLIQGIVLNNTYYILSNKNNKKIYINCNKIIIKNKNIIKKNIIIGKIQKMSKSKKNGINPQYYINKYGIDIIKLFIIFSSPIEKKLIWKHKNIKGCKNFLFNLWNFYNLNKNKFKIYFFKKNKKKIIYYYKLNKFFKKINNNYKEINYNTIVSYFMKILNIFKKKIKNNIKFNTILIKITLIFFKLLYPIIPYIIRELWSKLNFNKFYNNIENINWPNISNFKNNKIKIIVQVNGKFKFIFKTIKNTNLNLIKKKITNNKKIKYYINNKKNIKKIIFIKNKILNFII